MINKTDVDLFAIDGKASTIREWVVGVDTTAAELAVLESGDLPSLVHATEIYERAQDPKTVIPCLCAAKIARLTTSRVPSLVRADQLELKDWNGTSMPSLKFANEVIVGREDVFAKIRVPLLKKKPTISFVFLSPPKLYTAREPCVITPGMKMAFVIVLFVILFAAAVAIAAIYGWVFLLLLIPVCGASLVCLVCVRDQD